MSKYENHTDIHIITMITIFRCSNFEGHTAILDALAGVKARDEPGFWLPGYSICWTMSGTYKFAKHRRLIFEATGPLMASMTDTTIEDL